MIQIINSWVTENPDLANFWNSTISNTLILITIFGSIIAYARYKIRIKWEKNIDYAHEGAKILLNNLFVYRDVYGQPSEFNSIKKSIDDSIERDQRNFAIDTLEKHCLSIEERWLDKRIDFGFYIHELSCIAYKTGDQTLIDRSIHYKRTTKSLVKIHMAILDICQSYKGGGVVDFDELTELYSNLPFSYMDLNSLIMKELHDTQNLIESDFRNLMKKN